MDKHFLGELSRAEQHFQTTGHRLVRCGGMEREASAIPSASDRVLAKEGQTQLQLNHVALLGDDWYPQLLKT